MNLIKKIPIYFLKKHIFSKNMLKYHEVYSKIKEN